jgi:hypothetical protein
MNITLSALLRTDLRYFVWKVFQTILPSTAYLSNWHIDAIVYQLTRIHAGENQRLLINQPPRSLKSICVSISHGTPGLTSSPNSTAQNGGWTRTARCNTGLVTTRPAPTP